MYIVVKTTLIEMKFISHQEVLQSFQFDNYENMLATIYSELTVSSNNIHWILLDDDSECNNSAGYQADFKHSVIFDALRHNNCKVEGFFFVKLYMCNVNFAHALVREIQSGLTQIILCKVLENDLSKVPFILVDNRPEIQGLFNLEDDSKPLIEKLTGLLTLV